MRSHGFGCLPWKSPPDPPGDGAASTAAFVFSPDPDSVLCPLGLSYAQTHRPHAVGPSLPWLLLVRISTLPLLSGVTSSWTAFPSNPPLIPFLLP